MTTAPAPGRRTRRIAAFAAVVLAAATGSLAAAPAHAATGDPDDPNYLGPLTVSPTSGSATAVPGFEALTTEVGCPEPELIKSSRTVLYVEGQPVYGLVATRSTGFDAPMNITGHSTTSQQLATRLSWPAIPDGGTFKILVTCEKAPFLSPNSPLTATDKYFAATLVKTSATTWAVAGGSVEDPTPTETTVTAAATSATSVKLTASVTPADAAGQVQFTQNDVDIDGALVNVVGGSATYDVTGLAPATEYGFGARFVPADADVYAESSADPTSAVTPADDEKPELEVSVPDEEAPSEPSGLTIQLDPAASKVTLTGETTRQPGQDWTATGELGNVHVNDDRRDPDGEDWSLTGSASPFAKNGGGDPIAATHLGWQPEKVSGAGTAGATVAPGANGGLSQPKQFASGDASADANVTTEVKAGLTLKVPAGTPGGDYTSTLTLTLI
ncbi:hypothetical protein GCM10027064_25340 [Microbacterium petrolearium]